MALSRLPAVVFSTCEKSLELDRARAPLEIAAGPADSHWSATGLPLGGPLTSLAQPGESDVLAAVPFCIAASERRTARQRVPPSQVAVLVTQVPRSQRQGQLPWAETEPHNVCTLRPAEPPPLKPNMLLRNVMHFWV